MGECGVTLTAAAISYPGHFLSYWKVHYLHSANGIVLWFSEPVWQIQTRYKHMHEQLGCGLGPGWPWCNCQRGEYSLR